MNGLIVSKYIIIFDDMLMHTNFQATALLVLAVIATVYAQGGGGHHLEEYLDYQVISKQFCQYEIFSFFFLGTT